MTHAWDLFCINNIAEIAFRNSGPVRIAPGVAICARQEAGCPHPRRGSRGTPHPRRETTRARGFRIFQGRDRIQ